MQFLILSLQLSIFVLTILISNIKIVSIMNLAHAEILVYECEDQILGEKDLLISSLGFYLY